MYLYILYVYYTSMRYIFCTHVCIQTRSNRYRLPWPSKLPGIHTSEQQIKIKQIFMYEVQKHSCKEAVIY